MGQPANLLLIVLLFCISLLLGHVGQPFSRLHAMDVRKYTLNYERASDNPPEFDVTCET